MMNLQQRRADLLRQRTEAEAAERLRIERETSHQRALATIESELAALAEQERQEQLASRVVENRQLIAVNHDTIDNLTAALDQAEQLIIGDVLRHAAAVKQTFDEQQNHADYTIAAFGNPPGTERWDRPITESDPEWPEVQARNAAAGRQRREIINQLPNGLDLPHALQEWVSRAHDDPRNFRIRQAVAFGVLMVMFGPNVNLPAPAAGYRGQPDVDTSVRHRRGDTEPRY